MRDARFATEQEEREVVSTASKPSTRVIWRAGQNLGVFLPLQWPFSTLIFHFFGSNCPPLGCLMFTNLIQNINSDLVLLK